MLSLGIQFPAGWQKAGPTLMQGNSVKACIRASISHLAHSLKLDNLPLSFDTALACYRSALDNPSTTYHFLMVALNGDKPLGCRTAEETGYDSGSLPGFSIAAITWSLSASLVSIGEVANGCGVSLKGSELQSSNFLQDLEFTSPPTQAGMYATGEVIEVTAILNHAVTFDGPPPVLLLQVGDNEREMTYVASASTGTSWVFRYTVIADDRDVDGISFDRYALHGYADADLSI